MVQEPDILTDFLVVGKGQIYAMSMDTRNRCAERMGQGQSDGLRTHLETLLIKIITHPNCRKPRYVDASLSYLV